MPAGGCGAGEEGSQLCPGIRQGPQGRGRLRAGVKGAQQQQQQGMNGGQGSGSRQHREEGRSSSGCSSTPGCSGSARGPARVLGRVCWELVRGSRRVAMAMSVWSCSRIGMCGPQSCLCSPCQAQPLLWAPRCWWSLLIPTLDFYLNFF